MGRTRADSPILVAPSANGLANVINRASIVNVRRYFMTRGDMRTLSISRANI